MSKVLKVMHVFNRLGVGGMEKVMADIIVRFDSAVITPVVCCITDKLFYGKQIEKNGIKVVIVSDEDRRFLPRRIFALAKLFKDEKIDIVHSHSGVYRDAALAAMFAKIPVIVHTDHGKFYPDTKISRLNHYFFSLLRDRVIAVSDELKKFLIADVRINKSKVVRIYNAVDVFEYCCDVDVAKKKRELKIDINTKVVGVVARLSPVKDHQTLFYAFKKVKEKHNDVKLVLVGSGSLENNLKKLSVELGLENSILFLGKRSDVKELLPVMDIVCLSSLSEGLSITLTEAMAAKRPVVATNVGGNSELVVDGVTGLLVKPRNSDEMAKAINRLLDDSQLRLSMGNEGQKRVEREFNIDKAVRRYEQLYVELAQQKGVM